METTRSISERGIASADTPEILGDEGLRLWLQLMKCAKTFEATVATRFRRDFGQSLARFDVLSQLYRLPGHRGSVGQIAATVMAASGNITALIDRMADEGLVDRKPNPADRRSNEVHLTEAGLSLFEEMSAAHSAWIESALQGFPDADRQTLTSLLRNVRRTVEGSAKAH